MKFGIFAAFALFTLAAGPAAPGARAQTKPLDGDAEAGRIVALRACTGCHVVSANQPFKPVYVGPPYPPNFKEIASRPGLSAASLRHHLETLPAVPQKPQMPKPVLSAQELRDVVAFIVSLRDKQTTPAQ